MFGLDQVRAMFASLTTASVFLAYRRDDSRYPADALRRDLQDLGHTLFFDMTHMRAADEYRSVINRALDKCDVAVILIGPDWLSITDRHGRRRLDDPNDMHRLEVARALQRHDVAVLPVLVEGARMPDPEDLPEDIRGLAAIQAVEMVPNHWDYGVQEVHETVEAAVRRRWSAWAEAVVVAGVVAVPAGVIAGLHSLATTHVPGVGPGEKLLRVCLVRGVAWALIAAAVVGWVMWRRGGRNAWMAGVRVGALWGAASGIAGSLVYAVGSFWIATGRWDPLGLGAGAGHTVREVSFAVGTAVIGAGIGALLGAVFTPSGVKRGAVAGLAGGALIGWGKVAHVYVLRGGVAWWVVYALAVVGAVLAVQYLTRAWSYGRQESRYVRTPGVRIAG